MFTLCARSFSVAFFFSLHSSLSCLVKVINTMAMLPCSHSYVCAINTKVSTAHVLRSVFNWRQQIDIINNLSPRNRFPEGKRYF